MRYAGDKPQGPGKADGGGDALSEGEGSGGGGEAQGPGNPVVHHTAGNCGNMRHFKRLCVPRKSVVPYGNRSLRNPVGDNDTCGNIHEAAGVCVAAV